MKIRQWPLFMMFALAMATCSGDSNTSTTKNDDGGIGGTGISDDDGGIGGTGVSSGPIEDFGSLWVNGVKFNTNASTVIIEGGRPVAVPDVAALQRYLKRGMIVRVHGTVNPDGKTGVADRVFYGDTVQGAIVALDPAAHRMTVLDRKVLLDATTVIGEANFPRHTLESFRVGNVVEVSGFATSDGAIRATWIGLLGADASGRAFDVETRGTVAQHNETTQTFFLGDIQIQYGGLQKDRRPVLANGQVVEVRGRALDARQSKVDATYIAVEEDDAPLPEGDAFWLDGVVTEVTSEFAFEVDHRPIVTHDETVFEGGTFSDLKPNVRVEVQGEVDGKGARVARTVIFHDPPPRLIPLAQTILLENEEGEDVAVQIVAGGSSSKDPIYRAAGLPPGLALDAATGLISGVLTCESEGVYQVGVSLEGTSVSPSTWVWMVDAACNSSPPSVINRPPILASSENRVSGEEDDILLEIEAVDPDGDALTFESVGLPPGFVLDAATGVLISMPDCASAGTYSITLRATDGTFTDEISFDWTVEEGC